MQGRSGLDGMQPHSRLRTLDRRHTLARLRTDRRPARPDRRRAPDRKGFRVLRTRRTHHLTHPCGPHCRQDDNMASLMMSMLTLMLRIKHN